MNPVETLLLQLLTNASDEFILGLLGLLNQKLNPPTPTVPAAK